MSALVAFTGPPDSSLLQRMWERLAHRGKLVGAPIETPFASFAVLEWPEHKPPGTVRSQYFTWPDLSGKTAHVGLSGFAFETPSDLHQLEGLRGSFAWVACEEEKQELRIARDAVGTQSLYYGRVEFPEVGTRWLVATEPKAITEESTFQPRLRPESVAQYLAFSFVPAERTMLEDLYEAEAGWQIRLRSNQPPIRKRCFRFEEFEAESTDSGQESDAYWAGRTREVVEQAVAERLVPDSEPLVFLE